MQGLRVRSANNRWTKKAERQQAEYDCFFDRQVLVYMEPGKVVRTTQIDDINEIAIMILGCEIHRFL